MERSLQNTNKPKQSEKHNTKCVWMRTSNTITASARTGHRERLAVNADFI